MKIDLAVEMLPDFIDLVLVIGLPGSGKSSVAGKLASEQGLIHLEADQFFIDTETGEYIFNQDRIEEAQQWCFAETKRLLDNGKRVVVANTFATTKSRMAYFELGYKVAVHLATGNHTSVHNVPEDVIERMREIWQPYHLSEFTESTKPEIHNDLRFNWPITVQWGRLPGNYKSPVFFDRKLGVMEAFTRYCLDLADLNSRFKERQQAHKSQIDSAAQALKSFAEFLRPLRLEWDQVDDGHIEQYRAWLLERIERDPRSRDDLSRKRTVNVRMREIYNFYYWAQEEAFLVDNYIGWELDSKIRSKLPAYIKKGKAVVPKGKKGSLLYPKTFTRTGSSSDVIDYTADARDREKLKEYFESQGGSGYVKRRNILMMEIASAMGWRQGSLNSLLIDSFSDEQIDKTVDGVVVVKPPEQKFGYQYDFEVPLPLVLRINRHIKADRAALLKGKAVTEEVAMHHLFLSSTTATPLASNAISIIFSKAFTAIGAPKGAGIHSLRRGFTNDEIRFEIDARKRHNLSTAPEDVMLPVQRKLGQKSPLSMQAYADGTQSLTKDTVERELREENLQLRAEIAEKDREIAILVSKLDKANKLQKF
ncbi:MAG: ATP-binding protein [Candidatus Thiodiazotropha endolucinida]|nr:ATP-binding protein [Candidatus Thiodiazotropha taylori]MCG8052651.1 ATP-binding protein [Candidatus Thiodiazotropha taylori]MCG8092199.1 ATP-binding protein [Candidatus Thiodiazotropha endolucinida]MCW4314472.1 ATP-binding protein [Candidatus Thiodiazotropha taylori]MCW4324085.1 ATP-binding protein [Candidatus Thiodiazotropha taylori]